MENIYLISLLISLIIIANMIYFLLKEKRNSLLLEQQLNAFKGQSEEEVYDKGKLSELGRMSAGITHEISNPLSIILGRITQMRRKDVRTLSTDEYHKGLEQIETQTQRIADIIQSVREYIYRDDNITEDFISVKELVDRVLVFYGQRLKNHGIELKLENIDKAYISGHKGQYEQALLNLIGNSFDAIDSLQEKWIEISAEKINENVRIYVKDSGHGIESEVRNKMLDPFFTTKKGKGTGLGLSVVKAIAHNHGGDLKYLDDINTTFVLELPEASARQYQQF